jgi:hypothetical protein
MICDGNNVVLGAINKHVYGVDESKIYLGPFEWWKKEGHMISSQRGEAEEF